MNQQPPMDSAISDAPAFQVELPDAGPEIPELPAEQSPAAAEMSQWQLMAHRFARHKFASWSLYVLVILYLAAAFAEVVAPADLSRRDLDHQFCPPQLPRWSWRATAPSSLWRRGI